MMPTTTLSMSRRVTFSSGHRYWKADRSKEENHALFGPWASPYNHGHNYVLWATVSGSIDPRTGMIVNIKRIDDTLRERIVLPFDQKSLNDEVEEFESKAPSLENILAVVAKRLRELPHDVKLTHLRLEETERLYAELDLTLTPMLTSLTRTYEFAASHRLHSDQLTSAENIELYGKCNNEMGHGHNYVLEVTIGGDINENTGMLAPLDKLDSVVNEEVVDRYDHKNLNTDVPEFADAITTSEVVVQTIWNRLVNVVPGQLIRVRLFETARNCFEVSR